jgi:nicotinamide-nucleotide amidase
MRVEIIIIGDEVLMGQVVNTNATYLGQKLTEAGVRVGWMTVVGDQRQPILHAFRTAQERADAVIITGGLGPTPDDYTKTCLVEFFQDKLIFKNDLLRKVQERFTLRGLIMPDTSRNQAEFPSGAVEIPNPDGTATGIHYSRKGREWFALPGVPFEMEKMVDSYVIPQLKKSETDQRVGVRILRTTGIGESFLLEAMSRLKEAQAISEIAFLPKICGVDLKITVTRDSDDEVVKRLNQVESMLRPDIEKYIYATGIDSIPEVVGWLAKAKGIRLAVAESCTGGLVAKLFTDVPGSSTYFDRGVVTYSNRAKTDLLGVSENLIATYGAVSSEVATAMAEGLLKRSDAALVASVTGIAGPDGGTEQKPIGLVYIGIADDKKTTTHEFRFGRDRKINRYRTAYAAIKLLHDRIKSLDSSK